MITPLILKENIRNAIRLLVADLNETSTWEAIASRASGSFAVALVSQLQGISVTDDSRILTNLLTGLGMTHIGTTHTHISLATALTDARQYLARQ